MPWPVKPIPAHKLPPPCGTDPAHLRKLIDNAIAQIQLTHGDDGRLPYLDYIDKCKFRLEQALS